MIILLSIPGLGSSTVLVLGTCTEVHIYQYLMYLSTWCMEMPKYLYLYLTKMYLVLTSNFPVLFIKKCKKS